MADERVTTAEDLARQRRAAVARVQAAAELLRAKPHPDPDVQHEALSGLGLAVQFADDLRRASGE